MDRIYFSVRMPWVGRNRDQTRGNYLAYKNSGKIRFAEQLLYEKKAAESRTLRPLLV
jgi:hypothetical protein